MFGRVAAPLPNCLNYIPSFAFLCGFFVNTNLTFLINFILNSIFTQFNAKTNRENNEMEIKK